METLKAIHSRLPDLHLVMHGSSSVPQELQDEFNAWGGELPQTWGVPIEEILEGIRYGVRKVNIDTDLRLAMTGAFRKVAATNTAEFDPRKFMIPAMDAVTHLCKLRYEQFGSAGHASKITPIPLTDMAARYTAGSLDQRVTTS